MSDRENPPDSFETEEEFEKENSISPQQPPKDIEEIDLSNIDDDFDEDDEFYAGGDHSKGKIFNIIGVICFVLAAGIGVWQFWLSGVDKYEERIPSSPAAIAAPKSTQTSVTPPPMPTPIETGDANLSIEPIIEKTADLIQDKEVPEGIPDVFVEMSPEEITDTAFDRVDNEADNISEILSETPEEINNDLAAKDISEVSNIPVPVTDFSVEEVEDMLFFEFSETEVQQITEATKGLAVSDIEKDDSIVEQSEQISQVAEKEEPITISQEKVLTTEQEGVLKKVAEVLPLPTESLAPIENEEFIQQEDIIVPETVEYGSLTPDEILERAVVVRPKPKKLVVVKKNSSSTSNRSILVAAERSLKKGHLADALSLYNDVLVKSPKDTAALMGKAMTLQKLNYREEALSTYQKIIAVDPNNLNAMTNYLSLLDSDNPVSTINRLKDLEDDHPNSAAIAGQIGMVYGEMKDVSNAARYFNKAQSMDPNNPVYPYNLAILSDRMGSQGKALEYYQKTLQLVLRYGGEGVVSEQVVARRIKELSFVN